jgi:hypothetical protein
MSKFEQHSGDDQAVKVAAEIDPHTEVQRLSRLIGNAPDPTTGREGAGLLGVVATIHTDVQEIKATFATMVEAQNRRRALQVKLGLAAIVPLIGTLVAAAVHYLQGFHR